MVAPRGVAGTLLGYGVSVAAEGGLRAYRVPDRLELDECRDLGKMLLSRSGAMDPLDVVGSRALGLGDEVVGTAREVDRVHIHVSCEPRDELGSVTP